MGLGEGKGMGHWGNGWGNLEILMDRLVSALSLYKSNFNLSYNL